MISKTTMTMLTLVMAVGAISMTYAATTFIGGDCTVFNPNQIDAKVCNDINNLNDIIITNSYFALTEIDRLQGADDILQEKIEFLLDDIALLDAAITVPDRATWIGVDCDALQGNQIADCHDANINYYTMELYEISISLAFSIDDDDGKEQSVFSPIRQKYLEDYRESIIPFRMEGLSQTFDSGDYTNILGDWVLHPNASIELFVRDIDGIVPDQSWCTINGGENTSVCGPLLMDYPTYISGISNVDFKIYSKIISVGDIPDGTNTITYYITGYTRGVLEY